jgi:membrane protein YqaA with SNARE-associated domain
MINPDRTELQVAAVIGAVLGVVTGYLLGRLAQHTYLGAHWRSRRQRFDLLSSGFSIRGRQNANPSESNLRGRLSPAAR